MAPTINLTLRTDCPFCGLPIERPKDMGTRRPGQMPVGACSCGAVYAFDVTGHNLGAAFIEALVFACNLDWDLAWGLTPEDDYLETIVETYDDETNLLVPGGSLEGRRIAGALYFVRMHDDIQAVTAGEVQRKLAHARPASIAPADTAPEERSLSRQDVETFVREYQVAPLLVNSGRSKRMIRDLQRLLYSGDDLLRLRAAEILGRLAARGASKDAFANLLKQLLASPEDPGTFCPGALDAAGEIIARAPEIYAGYLPTLVQYLKNDKFRPEVLRSLGKIAAANPSLLRKQATRLLPFLSDAVPETRGYAALLLGYLKVTEAAKDLEDLQNDDCETLYYAGGTLAKKTVRQLAATALQML
ncbi:MAG TPA: PBS lyase [Spirochaetia bacterium]|nr:PBS lyase [Spirochaetia bacterium]